MASLAPSQVVVRSVLYVIVRPLTLEFRSDEVRARKFYVLLTCVSDPSSNGCEQKIVASSKNHTPVAVALPCTTYSFLLS